MDSVNCKFINSLKHLQYHGKKNHKARKLLRHWKKLISIYPLGITARSLFVIT